MGYQPRGSKPLGKPPVGGSNVMHFSSKLAKPSKPMKPKKFSDEEIDSYLLADWDRRLEEAVTRDLSTLSPETIDLSLERSQSDNISFHSDP